MLLAISILGLFLILVPLFFVNWIIAGDSFMGHLGLIWLEMILVSAGLAIVYPGLA